jgi:sensor domain CHASE-containing protein
MDAGDWIAVTALAVSCASAVVSSRSMLRSSRSARAATAAANRAELVEKAGQRADLTRHSTAQPRNR